MQKLKHFILLYFLFSNVIIWAQKVQMSDEISVSRADMYSILGQYNNQISFCSAENATLNMLFFDNNLKKIGDREVKLLPKISSAKVIEIVSTRHDFLVVFSHQKRGKEILKIHRYDPKGRLTDSATLKTVSSSFNAEEWKVVVSEDKLHLLVYEQDREETLNAFAVRLDSLKTIWEHSLKILNPQSENDKKDPLAIIFSNDATMYAIREFSNKKHTLKNHRLQMTAVFGTNTQVQEIALPEFLTHELKFMFDNVNQRLVCAGLWGKEYERLLGYVMLSLPKSLTSFKMEKHLFDKELLTNLEKKKVNESKGVEDLKIRDMVLRRDGGCLLLVERVMERRRHTTNMMSPAMAAGIGGSNLLPQTDYYNEDILALSLHADGTKHWETVLYKKQFSQNDRAIYSSYFLMKSALGIRLLYNDDIDFKTTVSEYALDGDGKMERRTMLNTNGNDLMLRFRDAVQISASACLVPSESRTKVKIVKISY